MAKNLTVANLRNAAKLLGANVECDSAGRWETYQVCTPKGKCWEPGLHMLRIDWMAGISEHKQQSLQYGLDRIKEYNGFEDCTDPLCDYCCTPNE